VQVKKEINRRKLRKRDEQIESQKHNRRQITLKKDKKEKKDTKRLQRKKQVLVGKKERSRCSEERDIRNREKDNYNEKEVKEDETVKKRVNRIERSRVGTIADLIQRSFINRWCGRAIVGTIDDILYSEALSIDDVLER
jgi:hypothetical protein